MIENRLFVRRILPDGSEKYLHLFHVSLEGLKDNLICRDEEDYDTMVKNIIVRAHACNVIIVTYVIVSNHAHIGVLAHDIGCVVKYCNELKKVQSMWVRRKYEEIKLLHRSDVCISEIDTVRYARNALAYIARNALDNGAVKVADYKWTGYRGIFGRKDKSKVKKVKELNSREVEKIFHTGNNLRDVEWEINDKNELEPFSACDNDYLMMIFNGDISFLVKQIGNVNMNETSYLLNFVAKGRISDEEFFKIADDYSRTWYGKGCRELNTREKFKFIEYLKYKTRLVPSQIARCLSIDLDTTSKILGK